MKETGNNQIDLLLRSLAKHEKGEVAYPEIAGEYGSHLDADELNSYAEGVLAPATRARYLTHIADCASCRAIVTKLTLAAGTSTVKKPTEPETSKSLWRKLVAFFSPQVLRIAIPALAVFAVTLVSIVALREQRRSVLISQSQPASKEFLTAENKKGAAVQNENTESNARPSEVSGRSSTSTAAPANREVETDKKAAGKTRDTASTGTASTVASERELADSPRRADAISQPSYAPEPAAPGPKTTKETAADSEKAQESSKEQAEKRDTFGEKSKESQQSEDEKRRSKDESAGNRPESPPPAATIGGAGIRSGRLGAEEQRNSVSVARKAENKTETRTVAGRRFRRQGTSWIDTEYVSSQATTNVARGSEQYRALVADEPTIRSVAEQLEGEVVVIWKGKAYRIR
jgi:Putative zinc-finger